MQEPSVTFWALLQADIPNFITNTNFDNNYYCKQKKKNCETKY